MTESRTTKLGLQGGLHFFVNNCVGAFLRGTLNWFGLHLFPNMRHLVIGSYQKSLDYIKKKQVTKRDIDRNILPFMSLNPILDVAPNEKIGNFYWQYPFISPNMAKRLFESYKTSLKKVDDSGQSSGVPNSELYITPVFSRYRGSFELMIWCNSIYELIDFRHRMLQFCGGLNRHIRPTMFNSYIVLSDDLLDLKIQDINEDECLIDWDLITETKIIDNLGKEKRVLPVLLCPIYSLTSIMDASEKYIDDISTHKFVVTFEYDVALPSFIVVTPWTENIRCFPDLHVDIVSSKYSAMSRSYLGQFDFNNGWMLIKKFVHVFDSETMNDYYDSNTGYYGIYNYPKEYFMNDYYKVVILSYNGVVEDYKLEYTDNNVSYPYLYIKIEPKEYEAIEIFVFRKV